MKTRSSRVLLTSAVLFFFVTSILLAQASASSVDSLGKAPAASHFNPIFPHALTQAGAAELSSVQAAGFALTTEDTVEPYVDAPRLQSVLLNNDVFALYGKPGSRSMGILGQYSLEDLEPIMKDYVKTYDAANGDRGIIPAFYIIYGTCWPEGEIGYLSDDVVRQYIQFAADRGWYVFLDHQIGKYPVDAAMRRLLPWLKYPNVQLALDPEWRTTKPMQEIGSVTADEVNMAQQMIQDYMVEHGLPGRRMFVIHQFKPKMILNRAAVRSDFELVQLIHCADGFGAPSLKKNTYAQNAEAKNIPLKSFKLFLKPTIEKAGYDVPLMTPDEVYKLDPRPYLIMYQ